MTYQFSKPLTPIRGFEASAWNHADDARSDIVDETYAVTVDPHRYEQLLTTWQRYVEPRMAMMQGEPNGSSAADPALEAHCRRALQIFERIGRRRQAEQTAEAIVAGLPVFAVVTDARGTIIAANQPAEMLNATHGECSVSRLNLDEEASAKLDAWLISRPTEGQAPLVLPCRIGEEERPSCIIGKRVHIASSDADPSSDHLGGCFLLTTVDIRYHDGLEEAIDQAFTLTQAETEIALALARGRTPAAIAAERAASLETVRTQIKSIQRKLDVRTAPELVSILNGFAVSYALSNGSGGHDALPQPQAGYRRSGRLLLGDGRWLAFEESGAENGRPVLFVHDMMHAPGLTDAAIDAAGRKNWRLISPSRPGFGQSDDHPGLEGLERLDAFALDVNRLLDHLGIESVIAVGHMSGGMTAIRLAALLPDRVRALALVSCVPNWTDANLALLPARIRLFALTVLYAPAMLPLLARAGTAFVDAGNEDQLIGMFHGDIPADMLALRRPEVRRIVVDGIRHGLAQGVAGFCHECRIVLRDWTDRARLLRQPIHLLHGALDVSCRVPDAERFVGALPNASLNSLDGVGLHLLYTHWPTLLELLADIDQRSASS